MIDGGQEFFLEQPEALGFLAGKPLACKGVLARRDNVLYRGKYVRDVAAVVEVIGMSVISPCLRPAG